MPTQKHILIITLLTLASITTAMATRTQPDTRPQPAMHTISSLAFLAGTWIGEMNETYVEETWSHPRGNNIIGHFRWLRPDGKPILFEILTITEEDDTLRLRLRHYNAELIGREDRDKPMTLRLDTLEGSRVVFKAQEHTGTLTKITYEVADEVLTITVEFGEVGLVPPVVESEKP